MWWWPGGTWVSALDSPRADSRVPLKALGCSFSSYNTRPAARTLAAELARKLLSTLLRTTMKYLDISLNVIMKVKVKVTQLCPTLCDPMDYTVHGILQARILEWVAFPFFRGSSQPRDWTQVSCFSGGFFYQLSHKGSPRILEWVAYPFSSGSSQPRNGTRVSCIAGRFFTNWAIIQRSVSFLYWR